MNPIKKKKKKTIQLHVCVSLCLGILVVFTDQGLES